MYRSISILIFVVCSAIYAAEIQAQTHVGNFFCSDCGQFEGVGKTLTPDVNKFVRTVVNHYLPVGGWKTPNGTFRMVTICNGSVCVTYQMTANGMLVQITPEIEDDHESGEYANDEPPPPPVNPIAGGGGAEGGGGSGGGSGGGGWNPPAGCYGACSGTVEIGDLQSP